MRLLFDTNGNDKQKQVAKDWLNPNISAIAYGGSKGSGKSYLGCSLTFGDAFIYPETFFFIARQELNDLRKYTIPSVYEVFDKWKVSKRYYNFNGQDNFFELYNKSRVYLIGAAFLPSDPDFQRFGSMQMTRGWCEEAGQMHEKAVSSLSATVGRWKNDKYNLAPKVLQTCNPSKNYLYREYYKKHKEGKLEPWKSFVQALPEDNKMLPAGYLENLHRVLSKNEKERLLYGNWEYDTDPRVLIDYEKILDCFTNDFPALSGDKYITVDLARLGGDRIVIVIWNGWRCKIIQYTKQKLNITGAEIEKYRTAFGIPKSNVVCDDDGLGGGVTDYEGYQPFVNNSSPLPNPLTFEPENYQNLKSQCYFRLAERINKGGLYINCSDPEIKKLIIEDLEQVKQKDVDTDGKKSVMKKEDVKKELGRSPDFSDALMMREYFELKPALSWIGL